MLKISMIQRATKVGDLDGNLALVLKEIERATLEQCDVLIFPELTLTSYPPEDLLFRSSYPAHLQTLLKSITEVTEDLHVLVGAPDYTASGCYNAIFHVYDGKIVSIIHKRALPNDGVFDERRYFIPGSHAKTLEIKGYRVGVLICEDAWHPQTVTETLAERPDFLIQVNASPFELNKQHQRYAIARNIIHQAKIPLLSLNAVGAQDELIFDGASFIMNQEGALIQQAPFFEPYSLHQTIERKESGLFLEQGLVHPVPNPHAQIYRALVLGLKTYVEMNEFKHCLLGLSGGIDSALTLAIAVDALGAESVTAVMMPSQYTSKMSIEDAHAQAEILGARYIELPINHLVDSMTYALLPAVAEHLNDVTAQNLQARARGILLMGLSNQLKALVLTTSNKSELAMGYATLYGDLAGGFDVLKDVYKTQVYALSLYRNALSPVIPLRVLTRAPSAELKADQTDQDTLPPYEMLDAILQAAIEHRLDEEDLVQRGFDRQIVRFVLQKLWQNEYKRRQCALGPKVSGCSFGRDWRIPISKTLRLVL